MRSKGVFCVESSARHAAACASSKIESAFGLDPADAARCNGYMPPAMRVAAATRRVRLEHDREHRVGKRERGRRLQREPSVEAVHEVGRGELIDRKRLPPACRRAVASREPTSPARISYRVTAATSPARRPFFSSSPGRSRTSAPLVGAQPSGAANGRVAASGSASNAARASAAEHAAVAGSNITHSGRGPHASNSTVACSSEAVDGSSSNADLPPASARFAHAGSNASRRRASAADRENAAAWCSGVRPSAPTASAGVASTSAIAASSEVASASAAAAGSIPSKPCTRSAAGM